MAIVVRTERFKDNYQESAHRGPGTYVGQDSTRNELKDNIVPFSVNIDRKLIREEQDMDSKDVHEHIEDHVECRFFIDPTREDSNYIDKRDMQDS